MVHVELVGRLFEIDLTHPGANARTWFGSLWIDHFLTNEEVLFNAAAHTVPYEQLDVLQRATGADALC
jgi:hypothetical protein